MTIKNPRTDPRESKLPVWARDRLAEERRRAQRAEERVAAYEHEVGRTRIWYGDYTEPVFVPMPHGYQTVHFNLSGSEQGRVRDEIGVQIWQDYKGETCLEIQGGDSVLLELQSANRFLVKLDRG